MGTSRARLALILLNVGLMGAIAYLVDHAVRRGAPTDVPPGPPPLAFAIDTSKQGPSADPSAEIGAELDRPLPVEAPPPPPPPDPPPTLEQRFRLLLVSEDPDDPARSTAIVAVPTGEQRTLTLGETLDGAYQVVGLAVQGEGDARSALLIVERAATGTVPGDRQVLRTVRP